jgi:polyisoprenoid-binding protein YceI
MDGRWVVGAGSIAGYRMGYSTPLGRGTRVGRTDKAPGEIVISGTTVPSGTFSIDMRTVECDAGSSCTEHVNQMMDTEHHPFETFVLSTPIELGNIPAAGQQITASVTGQLTLRGVTRVTTFSVKARRNGGRIEVLGSIPVNRDDYGIPDSDEPGFTIDKDGTIEFLLMFDRG